jgi:hypothetical protein
MTVLSVSGQIAMILLHQSIEPEGGSCIIIVSVCSTVFLMVTYFKMGQINEYSKNCIESWKRICGKLLRGDDNKLFRKYLSSLQPCKIELGEFGFYRKHGSLRIIGKLLYYTTKGIMLLGKFIPH